MKGQVAFLFIDFVDDLSELIFVQLIILFGYRVQLQFNLLLPLEQPLLEGLAIVSGFAFEVAGDGG